MKTLDIAARQLASNAGLRKRIDAELLWEFVGSLRNIDPDAQCLGEALVVRGLPGLEELQETLSVTPDHIQQQCQTLYRSLLVWLCEGRGGSPVRVGLPPEDLSLRSLRELEGAIASILDDETLAAIDWDVSAGLAERDSAVDGQAEDERAAEPASPSTVVSFAPRKPELIGRSQYMADATLPLAAATKASKVSSLTKYEGWDIRFGDWICEFYTDGRHIHVAGLPEKEVLEVKLGGKTYTLRWVPELNMHLVHGLSRRGLSETVKALQRGDETAFAVT